MLELISEGLTTRELSAVLGISVKTVASYKERLFARLGVRSQAQAVAVALRQGLLGPQRPSSGVGGFCSPVQGETVLAPAGTTTVGEQWRRMRAEWSADGARPEGLTQRGHEVVAAMAEGLSTKSIGRQLGVTAKTVEGHKTRVFEKLDARTQAHAVRIAITLGLAAGAHAPATSVSALPSSASFQVAHAASVS